MNCAFENARKCALQKDEPCVYDTFARFVIINNNNNKTIRERVVKVQKNYVFFLLCELSECFFSLFFPSERSLLSFERTRTKKNNPEDENLA